MSDPNCHMCNGTGKRPMTDNKGFIDLSVDGEENCTCQTPVNNLGFIQDIIDIEQNATFQEKHNGLWSKK